jgi:hypothetical protein
MGGDYAHPTPDTAGWSDGVPDGDTPLWCSTRVFASDGADPQQSAWTTPRQLTDTADFDVCYSASADKPTALPLHHGTQTDADDNGWHNVATSADIWMATSKCKNGIWEAWQVNKIKGEKGEQGDPGKDGSDGNDGVNYELVRMADTEATVSATGTAGSQTFKLHYHLHYKVTKKVGANNATIVKATSFAYTIEGTTMTKTDCGDEITIDGDGKNSYTADSLPQSVINISAVADGQTNEDIVPVTVNAGVAINIDQQIGKLNSTVFDSTGASMIEQKANEISTKVARAGVRGNICPGGKGAGSVVKAIPVFQSDKFSVRKGVAYTATISARCAASSTYYRLFVMGVQINELYTVWNNTDFEIKRFIFTPKDDASIRMTVSECDKGGNFVKTNGVTVDWVRVDEGDWTTGDDIYTSYEQTPDDKIAASATEIKQTESEIQASVSEHGDVLTSLGMSKNGIAMKGKSFSFASSDAEGAEKYLELGKNGATFSGTVKAKNLYHNVCIWGQWDSMTFYDYDSKKYMTHAEAVAADNDYMNNYEHYCTGKADVVIVPWYNTSSDNDQSWVRKVILPAAADYEGKMIEILDTAYGSGGDITVYAKDPETKTNGGHFALGLNMGDSIDIAGNNNQSLTLAKGTSNRFLSIKVNGVYYWLRIQETNIG